MERNSNKNQEIKRRFVEREVVYCVSTLVYELGEIEGCMDDIMEIRSQPDYESSVEYADGFHVQYSNHLDGWVWVDKDSHIISDTFNTDVAAYQNCVDENNLDYEYTEAYEHWIVSDYLAKKLEEQGEIVGDLYGLTVWGRCTTGQAILLDGVISNICEEMEILEGQRNEWK